MQLPNSEIYRIAGGAPIYISDCAPLGGCSPITQMSDLSRFAAVPANNTQLAAAETGRFYKIAGGAPLYLHTCDTGCGPLVEVDQASIDNTNGLSHLNPVPTDGTQLGTPISQTGRIYKIAGGAPLYLHTCDTGCGPLVEVDQASIDNADGLSHLYPVPTDGTQLGTPTSQTGRIYKIAGGAAIYLHSCDVGCGPLVEVDQASIDNTDGLSHLSAVPANGTFIGAVETGGIYRAAGGAPLYVNDCNALGFPNCDMRIVNVNQASIDNTDGLSHLNAVPANGTILQGEPSGQLWTYASGCRASTTTSTGAVAVNDAAIGNFTVCPSISTASLRPAAVQKSYSATLTAAGGKTPYSWAVVSGGLPLGLSLSASGVISGTPTKAGTFGFTVRVTDSSGPALTATKAFAIVVRLAITPPSLPNATVNSAYSASLAAAGGTAPYSWSRVSGSLPTGLSLSRSGVISGIPTMAGTFSFAVRVTDSSSPALTATKTFSITVS